MRGEHVVRVVPGAASDRHDGAQSQVRFFLGILEVKLESGDSEE
jgi:hypothetical protein